MGLYTRNQALFKSEGQDAKHSLPDRENGSPTEAIDPPRVSILILNYNGKKELTECIESLSHTHYRNLSLVVVDNASTDGSVQEIRQKFPLVRTILLDKNYGFGRAYNLAMDLVDSDYVLLLNNDITAQDPQWLSYMIKVAESDRSIGAVGSKLVVSSRPDIIDAVGGIVYRWMGCSPLGHGEQDLGQYDKAEREPFYMGGGTLLMKKQLYTQLGGFDSRIFAYAEDLDICWRMRLLGYHVKLCPQAVLLHKGSSLWKKFSSTKLRLSQQNFLYCCLKNYSAESILREIPFLITLNVAGSLVTSLIDRKIDVFLAVLKSIKTNLLSIRHTTFERRRIQRDRKVSEQSILEMMGRQRLMTVENTAKTGRKFRSRLTA